GGGSMPVGALIVSRSGRCNVQRDKIVYWEVIGGRLCGPSTSGAVMRIVLVLVVLVLVLLLWRAFVFDRQHRGQLRSAADIAGDARRNRDEQSKGSDPSAGAGA